MRIDEAIRHARRIARMNCGKCADDHKQLAGWLQELMLRRQFDEMLWKEYDRIRDAYRRIIIANIATAVFIAGAIVYMLIRY